MAQKNKNDIIRGDFVISLAGRDNGRFFIALDAGEGFAYIADGMLRSVAKPKKKKLRHLKHADIPAYKGEYTDAALRKAVEAVRKSVIIN